ncbi:MAG: reprolysin-like metallopeptidase, partial [Thermoanaerobaculia bacterium]
DRVSGAPAFHCDFEAEAARAEAAGEKGTSGAGRKIQGVAPLAASGPTLRTYRLALAGTGEYTVARGGTVASAQASMVVTMNRVDGVYENEVGVRLVMIDNTAIVYTNAATDPYANTSGDLTANQNNINAVIGTANYDIGHLFGTGGGGVAQLGVPCGPSKARGLTGSPNPTTDAFDIDYVAHEMGHQFGGNHTFNGTTSNCGGGNRSAGAAYEPGSGSTIMAYAGICGAENLQPNSDPYFHTKSFDEIIAFITGSGNSCAVQTSTGNSAPIVNAGATITIPISTPFSLTGSATDPDLDALTYCWEEFDLGTAAPPNTDVAAARPILRSFNPVLGPTRTFPKLSDLLTNTSTFGESLPSRTRTMAFRLIARDNRSGGGGVNYATRTVSVSSTAGPFLVTSPNTAVSYPGGSTQTVTWNVANTSAAPVSCASTAISLSTDGGTTFATTLNAGTPNDGSEPVSLPNISTSLARVKVECATAPFFDISNTNFAITTCPVITVTNPVVSQGTAGTPFSQTFTQTGATTPSFTTASTLPTGLTLSTAGVLSGTPTQIGTFPITVTVTDTAAATNGCTGVGTSYSLKICPVIAVTNPVVTQGTSGTPFSQTFTQTGATTPSFTTASTLPTGLTLSAAGVLSGTPTQSGTFPITVTVTDTAAGTSGCTGVSATYSLVIASSGASFYSVAPCRMFDTRNAAGADAASPILAPGESRVFAVAGRCSVPGTALSLSVNVTVTSPTDAGFLVIYRTDLPSAPIASTINFTLGTTRANNALVDLAHDASGTFTVVNNSAGAVQLIVDVNGYTQ